MKHQQVVVDYWTMLKTSCTCLLLAISGYVLIKMVQTIFYLPGYLKSNQKRLEDLAAKYNLDLEKEIAEDGNDNDDLLKQNELETSTILKQTKNGKDIDLVSEPKKSK